MAKDDLIPAEGTIIDKQPNAFFKVRLDNSEHVVLAAISGKMRKHRIRILVGRSRHRRDVTLRPRPWPDYLPLPVICCSRDLS